MSTQQPHRPGPFKLQNKQHKSGRHRTKGQIDRETRGRKDVKTLTIRCRKDLNRIEKRKAKKSALKDQRQRIQEENRIMSRAPTLVTVLSFNQELDSAKIVEKLASADPESQVIASDRGNITYIYIPRFRARYGFVCPLTTHLDNVLDCLKVSDVLLFAWPLEDDLTEEQSLLMSTILAHGIPSEINVVGDIPSKGKQRDKLRQNVLGHIENWSLSKERLFDLDTEQNALKILRQMQVIRKKPTMLQQRRPHLMVEKMEAINVKYGLCTLKLTGFIRGPPMNANRLIHIQGLGDFQLDQIDLLEDPLPGAKNTSPVVSFKPDENQVDLNSEVIPDPMDAEQPNVDDMLPKNVFEKESETKLVPKGTSSYQAAWILDDEENDDDEDDDEDMDEEDSDEDESDDDLAPRDLEGPGFFDNEGMDIDQMTVAGTEAGEYQDMDIDMDAVEKYRQERENAQFPDEVDTPLNQPAAERFQKYRGLKSFRTSPWDPKENLPNEYARIFKFGNFKHTKKLVLKEIDEMPTGYFVTHGDYVSLYVKDVPAHIVDEWGMDMPMVVYGLLKHEHRMSVLNVVLRKHPSCTVPVKNKENLIYHVGFRRYEANAVFSQHTNGDKFKMERFMPVDGSAFVATMFAPIIYPPASVLVFRRDAKGQQHLVASGSVLDTNPDRIILKRVVLSGHIAKVNRRLAIVRFMFFNRDDIEWFKPVEVYTPQGRRGHIKESLGTHGHMKCLFDQPLTVQDNVLMNLYKRTFPKWTYNPRIERPKMIGGGMVNSHSLISLVHSTVTSQKGGEQMEF